MDLIRLQITRFIVQITDLRDGLGVRRWTRDPVELSVLCWWWAEDYKVWVAEWPDRHSPALTSGTPQTKLPRCVPLRLLLVVAANLCMVHKSIQKSDVLYARNWSIHAIVNGLVSTQSYSACAIAKSYTEEPSSDVHPILTPH